MAVTSAIISLSKKIDVQVKLIEFWINARPRRGGIANVEWEVPTVSHYSNYLAELLLQPRAQPKSGQDIHDTAQGWLAVS